MLGKENLGSLTLISGEVSATISANYIVRISSTAGEMILPTGVADPIAGVVDADVAAGDPGEVQYQGMAYCVASGAIACGARVGVDNANPGKVRAFASDPTTAATIVGDALSAAATDGDIFLVMLKIQNTFSI